MSEKHESRRHESVEFHDHIPRQHKIPRGEDIEFHGHETIHALVNNLDVGRRLHRK